VSERSFGYAMLCASLLHAGAANAQQSPAYELDERARAAFSAGRYAEAAREFAAAHASSPHAKTAYNAALSWERAGDLTLAIDFYAKALALGGALDEPRQRAARQRIAALAKQLGRLDVMRPAGGFVTVAHLKREPLPATFYLWPGSHELVIETRDGQTTREFVRVEQGQALRLLVDVPAGEKTAAQGPSSDRKAARPQAASRETLPTLGWVFIGAGAACASTAIVVGLSAVSARDDFDASGRSDAEARDRAVTLRTWTNVAWGAAAATATTGVVLLLSARGGPGRASSNLELGPASLRYRLRF
jgi:tetratricopeptide (TPR) repeat protein